MKLPDLSSPEQWPSLDAMRQLFKGKVTWTSEVTSRRTRKTTISKDLCGSETKLTEFGVLVERVNGAPMKLTVCLNGTVHIPRKKGTNWSEVEHVLFVKHGDMGQITFHPVTASPVTTAAVAGPSKPHLTLTSHSSHPWRPAPRAPTAGRRRRNTTSSCRRRPGTPGTRRTGLQAGPGRPREGAFSCCKGAFSCCKRAAVAYRRVHRA